MQPAERSHIWLKTLRWSAESLVFKACCWALVFYAHGQVDKSEDVVLDQDGEAEEDCIQHQDVHAQLEIQPPLVKMDPKHL